MLPSLSFCQTGPFLGSETPVAISRIVAPKEKISDLKDAFRLGLEVKSSISGAK